LDEVAIVTDSTCCLPAEMVTQYCICVVPILIVYKGRSFRDGIDIAPADVYRIMRQKEELPTTSTPSAGDFLTAFRELSQQARSILCITVTGLQSRVFEAASAAMKLAGEEVPGTAIEVLDSRSVAGSLGFVVLEAARAASRGADLEQAVQAARNTMGWVSFLAVLDTLYYLARLGRIARAAAWAGSALDLKPVVGHSAEVGETIPVARPRTRTKAVERMMAIMAERMGRSRVHAMVHHADDSEAGKDLVAEIAVRFNCVELYLTEFTPGMGVHTGPGLLAVSFYAD